MYYTLENDKLKPLAGLVKVGDVQKNAQFLTASEAASLGAYERANNQPEEREGYRARSDGYELVYGKWMTRWAYDQTSVEELTQLYDNAMEDHLDAEKSARGYTKREPSDYTNSTVERYRQDAADWTAHRDAVMLYGLEIQNKAARGETVPTLEEFKVGLPKIVWTVQDKPKKVEA